MMLTLHSGVLNNAYLVINNKKAALIILSSIIAPTVIIAYDLKKEVNADVNKNSYIKKNFNKLKTRVTEYKSKKMEENLQKDIIKIAAKFKNIKDAKEETKKQMITVLKELIENAEPEEETITEEIINHWYDKLFFWNKN